MSYVQRVNPGSKVRLSDFDPNEDGGLSEEEGERESDKCGEELGDLQDLLFGAARHGLLIVLQGRDTAGKYGTIRHLLKYLNSQATSVAPFKVPTPIEIAHDFLWRVHHKCPGRGETVMFDRSHYEDVLVVRVHELAPESVWSKRYDRINEFERLLVQNRTIVLKFFLNITKEEQKERLLARENETGKAWKLNVKDWKERAYWDDYTRAYEDALSRCSVDDAPWHVVPSNKKWFRNLAVVRSVTEALREYREEWESHLESVGEAAKKELIAFRAESPVD